MAFHCVTSWPGWIFLCQKSWVVVPRDLGSCPETGLLNWFGTVKVRTQRQVIARLRMREVSKTGQGCHTCNRTAQHPVVKRPAVRSRQVPLRVFRVGQVNSGHGPLRGVVHTFTGAPWGKRNSEGPDLNDSSSQLSIFLLYFVEIITLLVVETNRYYHDHLNRLNEGPLPQPDVTGRNDCVSCNNHTNGTPHMRQTDRLLVKSL